MLSQLQIEKRNLESSILFMQQEHSNTLKALHEEISKLQKRCTELNFQLTMMPLHLSNADENGEELKLLKQKYAEEQLLRSTLSQELAQRDELIHIFRDKQVQQEKQFVEELSKKDHQIIMLKGELDTKSGNIAYLTTEMHKLKVLQSNGDPLRPKGSPPSRENSARVRLKAADISSRPVTAKGARKATDSDAFLTRQPGEVATEIHQEMRVKPTPPILPPISGGDEVSRSIARRKHLLRRRHEKQSTELETLAVDPLASKSNTRVNEPRATSE